MFTITTSGSGYNVLYFANTITSGLILSGSTLYGTGILAGASTNGIVFAVNTSGSGSMVLHSFTGAPDGADPEGGLTLSGSTLYGTTIGGGSSNLGTIFGISIGSGYTYTFYNLTSGSEIAMPACTGLLTATCTFQTYSPTNGNTFSYNLVVMDSPVRQ